MPTMKRIFGFAYIFFILLIHNSCSNTVHNTKYITNYLNGGDPVTVQFTLSNGTHQVLSQYFPIYYSLSEPEVTQSFQIPVFNQMDNLTAEVTLWSVQSKDTPISQTIRNFTRYAKIRSSSTTSINLDLQGIPEKHDQDAQYGLHIPVRYQILILYLQEAVPLERNYLNLFNFRLGTKNNVRHYIPPVDLTQFRVPFKTYKYVNHTNKTHQFSLRVEVYNFKFFHLFLGLTNRQFILHANPYVSDFYTQQMIDLIRQTIFDNNFYLVVLYFSLSFIQIIMQIFAFKNQIEVWKKIQNKPGLSIKTLYQRLFFQAIICLYLYEKGANKLFFAFQVIDLLLTIWKITRALKISISRQNRFILSIGYKDWYHNQVESADTEAIHYTNYLIAILFVPFLIYKLYPVATTTYSYYNFHKSLPPTSLRKIYMFLLQSMVFFILIFGFVMMTPQLYINYKLKSVDHLPWKTLIYRFIYTIIDDIFVFMIDLPWLQRMFSFRDDVIFVLYLIQRRIYKVDKNRLALSVGSVDLKKQSTQQSVQTTQQPKHIKSQ